MDRKGGRELMSEGKRADCNKDPVSSREMRSSSEETEMAATLPKGQRNVLMIRTHAGANNRLEWRV